MRRIDIFNHFFPDAYYRRLLEAAPTHKDMGKRVRHIPLLHDLDGRLRVMDRFGGDYQQVLSLPSPPIEALGDATLGRELARLANDGLADLVRRYPDRFPGFVASLPMNDAEAATAEAQRAIDEL